MKKLNRERSRTAAAAMAVLCLIAASCGGSDNGDASNGSANGGDNSATTATTAPGGNGGESTTTAAEGNGSDIEYDRDATLIITNDGSPTVIDPHAEPTQGDTPYWTPMYDTLTDITIAGEVNPRLAESWEYSEDGLALIFQIREGVSFHDGTALDADGVVVSLERARTAEESTQKNILAGVTGVEATGPMEVTLTLDEYDAALPWILGTAAGAVVNPQAIEAGTDLNTTSDGTGPYVLESFEPAVRVSYVRAEDENWDPNAGHLAGFTIEQLADYQVALNGLQAGQYDMIRMNGLGSQVDQVVSSGEYVRTELPGMQTLPFWLNNQDPVFEDVRVRQAMHYALDREAITNAVFDGGSECSPTSQPYPFLGDDLYIEGYDPYPYDPDKARALLEEAGAVGTELLITDMGATNTTNLMQAAQPMFEAVGFQVQLENSTAAVVAPAFQNFELQVAVIPNAKQAHGTITFQRYFQTDGTYHLAQNEDGRILELLDSIATPAATEAEVDEAYDQIARILAEDIATLVVVCKVNWAMVHRDDIVNVDPRTLLTNMRVVGVAKS